MKLSLIQDSSLCLHLSFSLSFTFSSSSHKHTGTHKWSELPSLWKDPAGSSLSCPFFASLDLPITHCCILDIKPGASFSLADASLFMPHSQRAFFNTQCTSSLVCMRMQRKKKGMWDSKGKAERNWENGRNGQWGRKKWPETMFVCHPTTTCNNPPWLLSVIVPSCLPGNPNTSAHLKSTAYLDGGARGAQEMC